MIDLIVVLVGYVAIIFGCIKNKINEWLFNKKLQTVINYENETVIQNLQELKKYDSKIISKYSTLDGDKFVKHYQIKLTRLSFCLFVNNIKLLLIDNKTIKKFSNEIQYLLDVLSFQTKQENKITLQRSNNFLELFQPLLMYNNEYSNIIVRSFKEKDGSFNLYVSQTFIVNSNRQVNLITLISLVALLAHIKLINRVCNSFNLNRKLSNIINFLIINKNVEEFENFLKIFKNNVEVYYILCFKILISSLLIKNEDINSNIVKISKFIGKSINSGQTLF